MHTSTFVSGHLLICTSLYGLVERWSALLSTVLSSVRNIMPDLKFWKKFQKFVPCRLLSYLGQEVLLALIRSISQSKIGKLTPLPDFARRLRATVKSHRATEPPSHRGSSSQDPVPVQYESYLSSKVYSTTVYVMPVESVFLVTCSVKTSMHPRLASL